MVIVCMDFYENNYYENNGKPRNLKIVFCSDISHKQLIVDAHFKPFPEKQQCLDSSAC